MWLKAQATRLWSHLLLHARVLKKVMCVSIRARGCLSSNGGGGGREGADNESLWLTVRTSLSLPPTNKDLKFLHHMAED